MAHAQEQASTFGEIVEVRIIGVEVVATEAGGNPVRGLTRSDFELQVGGESVPLSNFFEVDGGVVEPALGPPSGASPPARSTQGLHLAVVVDERHISEQSRAAVFERLRVDLDDTLQTGDRVLVARIRDSLEIVQGFTPDRDALADAFEAVVSGPAPMRAVDLHLSGYLRALDGMQRLPCSDQGLLAAQELAGRRNHLGERRHQDVLATLAGVDQLLSSIRGIPGRKALLFVSDGLPEEPLDSLVEAFRERFDSWIEKCDGARSQALAPEFGSAFSSSISQSLQTLLRRASASGAIFYPITHRSAASAGTRDEGAGSLSSRGLSRAIEEQTLMAPLLTAAEETGGQLSTNSAGLSDFLTRLREDFSSYYSLGFVASEGWGEDYKKINVSLKQKRPGVKLRHVDGFSDLGVRGRLEALARAAATHRFDTNRHGLIIQQRGQKESDKKIYQVSALLVIPMANLVLLEGAESHSTELDIVIVAVDERGAASPGRQALLPIVVPKDRLEEARRSAAGYPIELAMRAGRQTLAIAVHDRVSGVDSAATLELVVGSEN